MKRAIIIHGWEGTPNDEWIPWLTQKLREDGWSVDAPLMPDTKNPKLPEWMATLDSLQPDEDTTIIGHSLANALILHYLERSGTVLKAAFLVAAWDWLIEDVREFHHTFFEPGFNYTAIEAKHVPITIVNSTNDRWIDFERSRLLAEKVGGRFVAVEGAGHFMAKDGYKEFPLLLKLID